MGEKKMNSFFFLPFFFHTDFPSLHAIRPYGFPDSRLIAKHLRSAA